MSDSGTSDCLVCRKHRGEIDISGGVIYEDDLLFVSCVPWIHFTSISHPIQSDKTDSIPRISWGKFSLTGDQVSLPISVQLHHGLADGFHVGLFFKKFEELIERPEETDWPL
jgi:chloramphenicol O-acetyltransferase type A